MDKKKSEFHKEQDALILGADYLEVFSSGWFFITGQRVEISSQLNSKFLFKMIFQLHVKISTRLANPGSKFQIFNIINIFSSPKWKFDPTIVQISCLSSKTVKMSTSQTCFNWTDDKFIELIKCLEEFKSFMEFRNHNSNKDKVKLYESVSETLNRCI